MKRSFAVKLSLRFMFILTTALLLLSLSFLYFVKSLVKASQTEELKKNQKAVLQAIENSDYKNLGSDELEKENFQLIINDLPYYLTYIAYDKETEEILATNDPFLPLLKDSEGKARHYFEKDFFFDGNLDILYYADSHILKKSASDSNREVVVAVAMNIENDSFSMITAKLPLALILMIIPVLLLSFLVSLFITKNTIKPVVKITRSVQSMTTDNLDGQLPVTGEGDELDQLSDTFNDLFKRIKADFDRERQFSSDVSHELNTPLTVISGQANLLLRWGKDNPEQLEKSLNAIKNEAKSMHSIIENLLQLSRIESGRIKPQLSVFDLKQLLIRLSEEFIAIESGLNFEIDCKEEFKIETDSEMLHQILTIFISNSIKFAGAASTVKLSAAENEEGDIVIKEMDNGPGISDEALPHVFERFYRADEAHTRDQGGYGLGLAIAKNLSELLGFKISAGNNKGGGALFSISKTVKS